jgi:hypothetical protein
MTCTPIKMPGGGVAIVCTRGRRVRKCSSCSSSAGLECDGCDKPICAAHSFTAWKNVDYCPGCSTPVKLWWLEHEGAAHTGEPRPQLLAHFTAWARAHPDRFPRSKASKETG